MGCLPGSPPEITGLVGLSRDITEHKENEAKLEHQAFYDPLTDLANRSLLRAIRQRANELDTVGGAARTKRVHGPKI